MNRPLLRHRVPAVFAGLSLACLVTVVAPVIGSAQNPGYAVTKHFKIAGDGGWDYLAFDTVGHRLFISHGTHVQVVDPANGTVLGDIPNTPHVHGIALAYDLGRGFITAAGDTAIHIFDLKTLQPIGTAKADPDDDAIVYDPATKYVVSLNGDAASATVVNGATGTVVGTIKLPGKPEFGASDNHGMVYANIEDKNLLVALDLKGMKVARQWPLEGCESPSGLAIDRPHRRVFSGCHNKTMVMSDIDAGKVVASVPIGTGVDANRFDPGTQLAFSSQGDGTLTVAHEDSPNKLSLLGTVTTQRGARTMALDPHTHTIYLVTADFEPAQGNQRPKAIPGTFTLLVVEAAK